MEHGQGGVDGVCHRNEGDTLKSAGSFQNALICHPYLHMIHHHLVGHVAPVLRFMDLLVEQRLEK